MNDYSYWGTGLGQDDLAPDGEQVAPAMLLPAKEPDVPLPPVQVPVYYLQQFFTEPKERWEMLTGKSFDNTSPENIAEAYKKVVKKKVQSSGTTNRAAFGPWQGFQLTAPTVEEQEILDSLLTSSENFSIEHGMIVEGMEGSTPVMHVDYYVMVSPEVLQAAKRGELVPKPVPAVPEEPLPGSVGRTDRVRAAGVFGLVVGGLVTSLLVKKGVGLKVLAGVAGGVVCAGAFMRGAQFVEEQRGTI